jgi:hypothetical protein
MHASFQLDSYMPLAFHNLIDIDLNRSRFHNFGCMLVSIWFQLDSRMPRAFHDLIDLGIEFVNLNACLFSIRFIYMLLAFCNLIDLDRKLN